MLNNAAEYQKRISEAGARIQNLVEQARKQKDIIRFNCLADKLVQVRANMNVSEKALSSLQEAHRPPGRKHGLPRVHPVDHRQPERAGPGQRGRGVCG